MIVQSGFREVCLPTPPVLFRGCTLILLLFTNGCIKGPPSGDSSSSSITQNSLTESLTPVRRILANRVQHLLSSDLRLHTNHLGSLVMGTTPAGEILGRQRFTPLGDKIAERGFVDDYGFTGQEQDSSTGLLHFLYRDLDPKSGRWTKVDPLFLVTAGESLDRFGESTTGYTYVSNKSPNLADPSGLAGGHSFLRKGGGAKSRMRAGSAHPGPQRARSLPGASRPSSRADTPLRRTRSLPATSGPDWDSLQTSYRPTRKTGAQNMTNAEWSTYEQSSFNKMKRWAGKADAKLKAGKYLYHGTDKSNLEAIKEHGLQPAKNEWRAKTWNPGRGTGTAWDASKDGFLSMSTTRAGMYVAENAVSIRMQISEGDQPTFKPVGAASEVTATTTIPASRLEYRVGTTGAWQPLNP